MQPVEPQFAHAIEVGRCRRRGRMIMSASSASLARQIAQAWRGSMTVASSRPTVRNRVRADAAQRVVQLDRVESRRSLRRACRSSWPRAPAGPADRTAAPIGSSSEEADERHGVVLDGPDPQAVRSVPASNLGEAKLAARGRAPAGVRDRPASRHRHRLGAGRAPASSARRGTTLRMTRRIGSQPSRATRCIEPPA